MPNIGDNVDVLFTIQGGSVFHRTMGQITAVNGDDVEIDVGQPTPLSARVSDLDPLGTNEWELRVQVKTSA